MRKFSDIIEGITTLYPIYTIKILSYLVTHFRQFNRSKIPNGASATCTSLLFLIVESIIIA